MSECDNKVKMSHLINVLFCREENTIKSHFQNCMLLKKCITRPTRCYYIPMLTDISRSLETLNSHFVKHTIGCRRNRNLSLTDVV